MGPIVDWLVDIDIAVSDLQVESTLRVGANPGFVLDRGPLAAKIRKRHKVSSIAFLTFGEIVVRFQKPTSRPTITHSLYS
jgi:hypothetical protein